MRWSLLEREVELAHITAAVDSAVVGSGKVVVAYGEAGIGKSGLLREAAGLAMRRGLRVLTATGSPLEQDHPFGVVLQCFEPSLRSAGPKERRALTHGAAALAMPIFDARLPPPDLLSPDQSGSLFHGLYWLIVNLATPPGMLLVVDDVHWADRPSLRFLLYLAHRLNDLPISMAAAVRRSEPGVAQDLLDQFLTHSAAEILEPRPLSLVATSQLIRSTDFPGASDMFCGACAEVTRGNPFLLRELATALRADSVTGTDAQAESVRHFAPEAISRAVVLRLSRLAPSAVRLARAVAVLGTGADASVSAAVAEIEAEEAVETKDRLVDAGIFEPGDRLDLVHPVVQSSIVAEIPAGQRRRIHERAARLLLEAGAPVGQVASHLLQAGASVDSAWAVPVLRDASARALSDGDPAVAVRLLDQAMALHPAPALKKDIFRERGLAKAREGRVAAAEDFLNAVGLSSTATERAELYLFAGRALYWAGDNLSAGEMFDCGLQQMGGELAEDRLARELLAAYLNVATIQGKLHEEGRRRMDRLLGDARPGNTPMERAILAQVAVTKIMSGEHFEEPLRLATRALDGGRLLADESSDSLTFYIITGALVWSGATDLDIQVLGEAILDAQQRGSIMAFATASYCRAYAHYHAGNVLAAAADAERAVDGHRFGWEVYLPVACYLVTATRLERLDPQWQTPVVDPSLEARFAGSLVEPFFDISYGLVAAAGGRHAEAGERFLTAGARLQAIHADIPAIFPWRSHAALSLASRGDRAEARKLVEAERAIAERTGVARSIGMAMRAAALCGDPEDQVSGMTEAVRVLSASPARLEHARALVDLGAALRRSGQRIAARDSLAQGADLAHQCGSRALEKRSHDELVASGAKPRRSALSGLDALTPTEHRVASLAAKGLTNREIAEALFVSSKTVEFHLGNCYSKLRVAARGDLATKFNDLVPAPPVAER